MNQPIHISLTKLSRLPDCPNGVLVTEGGESSIEVDYTIRGHYYEAPKRGQPFVVSRYERNGVPIYGVFTTSPVQLISRNDNGDLGIKTENSIYLMKTLPDDSRHEATPL